MYLEEVREYRAEVRRVEKKVDKLGEQMGTLMKYVMSGAYLPDETPRRAGTPDQVGSDVKHVMPGNDRASKPTRAFAEYIKVPEKAVEILAQLHEWIDGRQRVKAILYIRAAADAQVLKRPPFVAANAEFPGRLGGKSLYYVYSGEPLAYNDEEDLEELRKAKEVLEEIAAPDHGRG